MTISKWQPFALKRGTWFFYVAASGSCLTEAAYGQERETVCFMQVL